MHVLKKFNNFLTIIIFFIFSSPIYAEILIINDTYDYNPLNETGNAACEKLKQKIKLRAIAKVSGEIISQDMLEICNGTNKKDECISNTSTFYTLGNAKITGFKIIEGPFFQEKSLLLDDHLRCRMKAKINVIKNELPDESFDFDIQTNNTMFKAPILITDNSGKPVGNYPVLEIILRTTTNMYFYFFNFLTYEKNVNEIKIIPTREHLTKDNKFLKKVLVTFPNNQNTKIVNEYLFIIGSDKRIDFLPDYNLFDFNRKLSDLYESKDYKIRDKKIGIQIVKK